MTISHIQSPFMPFKAGSILNQIVLVQSNLIGKPIDDQKPNIIFHKVAKPTNSVTLNFKKRKTSTVF